MTEHKKEPRGGYTTAGSGKSMARALYAALVLSFCFAMDWLALCHGTFNAYEAAAIATLCGGLAWPWVKGKTIPPPAAKPEPKPEDTP